jgi:hypothetical protein
MSRLAWFNNHKIRTGNHFVMVWILDVPQWPHIKGLVASLWHYWKGGRTFRSWGLVRGNKVIGGMPLKGYWDPLKLFLFASWLKLKLGEQLCSEPSGSASSQTYRAKWPWAETLKPWAKISLSSIVDHPSNPSYSGGRDQEDQCSKPFQAKI